MEYCEKESDKKDWDELEWDVSECDEPKCDLKKEAEVFNSSMYIADDFESMPDALVVSQILTTTTKSERPEVTKISRFQWFCMLVGVFARGYYASFNGAFGVYYVQYLLYFDVSHATGSWMRTIEQAFGAVVGECSILLESFLVRY